MTTAPKIAPELIWQHLEDNTIVVTPTSGKVRVLNGVGTLIWQHLNDGSDLSQIVDAITDAYDVDRARAEADLADFIEDLTDRGILVK